ncbi:unnamed protein product [Gadus morhua 'NCC']
MWSKGCAIAGARGHQISTLTRCPSADNECCGEGKSPKPVHGLEKRSDDLRSSKGELDRALNAPRSSSATPARGYTKQQLAPIVGLLRNPAESVARTGPERWLGLGDRSLGVKADSEGQEVVVLAQEVLAGSRRWRPGLAPHRPPPRQTPLALGGQAGGG